MNYDAKVEKLDLYVKAICEKDASMLDDLFSDDVVIEDPVGTPPHVGKPAALTFYRDVVFPSEPVFKRVGPVCAVQSYAVMPCQAETTGFTLDVIEKFEFQNHKIVSMQAFFGEENFHHKSVE